MGEERVEVYSLSCFPGDVDRLYPIKGYDAKLMEKLRETSVNLTILRGVLK